MSKPTQTLTFLHFPTEFLILLHQYILRKLWFETPDIHHETFSITFFSFSLDILLEMTKNWKTLILLHHTK